LKIPKEAAKADKTKQALLQVVKRRLGFETEHQGCTVCSRGWYLLLYPRHQTWGRERGAQGGRGTFAHNPSRGLPSRHIVSILNSTLHSSAERSPRQRLPCGLCSSV